MLLHVIKPTLPQSPNIPNIYIKKTKNPLTAMN